LKYDQIPSDFGKGNKPISITPSSKDRINNIILNAFEKYYKGPYSYVTDDKLLINFGYTFITKQVAIKLLRRVAVQILPAL